MSQKRPFWPFWPVISEAGWISRKKVPLGIRLKSTRRRRTRLFYQTSARGPEAKFLVRGCQNPVVEVKKANSATGPLRYRRHYRPVAPWPTNQLDLSTLKKNEIHLEGPGQRDPAAGCGRMWPGVAGCGWVWLGLAGFGWVWLVLASFS